MKTEVEQASPALAVQSGWRWCRQCASLWRPGLPYTACPVGGGLGNDLPPLPAGARE